jgi:hypothetical protein
VDAKVKKAMESSAKSSPKSAKSSPKSAKSSPKTVDAKVKKAMESSAKSSPKSSPKSSTKLSVKVATPGTAKVILGKDTSALLKFKYNLDVNDTVYYDKDDLLAKVSKQMTSLKISTLPSGITKGKSGKLEFLPRYKEGTDDKSYKFAGGSRKYNKYMVEYIALKNILAKMNL